MPFHGSPIGSPDGNTICGIGTANGTIVATNVESKLLTAH